MGLLGPKRSLRTLVLASNIVVALVFLLVAATVAATILAAQDGRQAENTSRAAEIALRAVRLDILDSETAARGFGLAGERRFLGPYRSAQARLRRDLPTLLARSRGQSGQMARAREITREVRSLQEKVTGPFVAARGRIPRSQQARFADDSKRRVDRLRRLFSRYLDTEARDFAVVQQQAEDRERLALAAIIGGSVIALLALMGQQLLLRRRVLEPLSRLGSTMGRLRGGDLEARARPAGEDEVARLGREFDAMADALAANVADLRRSNAELEQFAYVASHDLAEPLRVMAGFAELLQRRYQGQLDERADRFLQGISEGSERMRALIDDLLAYSRAGRQELELEPVDTDALVAAVVYDLSAAVRDAGAEVRRHALPELVADYAGLRVVFQNLISNALKFRGDAPPVIDVSAERVDGVWRFAVADNGIGVDPEHEERIFRMFQRLHTREEYPGTGIGLALVQRSLERQGGWVGVRPRDGGGTVFEFTLPAATLPRDGG
jgi:signal transduction histidine kinase